MIFPHRVQRYIKHKANPSTTESVPRSPCQQPPVHPSASGQSTSMPPQNSGEDVQRSCCRQLCWGAGLQPAQPSSTGTRGQCQGRIPTPLPSCGCCGTYQQQCLAQCVGCLYMYEVSEVVIQILFPLYHSVAAGQQQGYQGVEVGTTKHNEVPGEKELRRKPER